MRNRSSQLLTLTEWANFFRLDPYHIAGFSCEAVIDGTHKAQSCKCYEDSLWREFESMANVSGRESVSTAIQEAEDALLNYLGFSVAPRQFLNLPAVYDQPRNLAGAGWRMPNGRYKSVILPTGYLQRFGVRTLGDPDTVAVTKNLPTLSRDHFFSASATVASGTNPQDVTVWIAAADRLGEDFEEWQVSPVKVTVSGTTATIKIPAYLLADPALTHEYGDSVDRDNAASYVDNVEIRVYTWDDCQQGQALELGSYCDELPCTDQSVDVCAQIKDNRLGVVILQPMECIDGVITETQICPVIIPDKVLLNVVAGFPLENGLVARTMQAAICYLSASMLSCDLPHCDCKDCCVYSTIASYRYAPKAKTGEGEQGISGNRYTLLHNQDRPDMYPFGTSLGAIKAWEKVKGLKLSKGIYANVR